jgi:hypothetical protein
MSKTVDSVQARTKAPLNRRQMLLVNAGELSELVLGQVACAADLPQIPAKILKHDRNPPQMRRVVVADWRAQYRATRRDRTTNQNEKSLSAFALLAVLT